MGAIKKRESGFSLLELLAVMSIMGLLTTLAVTSYFGAARGMARRGSLKHLVNTLTLARQRACMDNARVSVVFYNEVSGVVLDKEGNATSQDTLIPSYVLCKESGKISLVPNDKYLVDEFNSLNDIYSTSRPANGDSYRGGFRLYNLSKGGFTFVYPWVINMVEVGLTSSDTGRVSPYSLAANKADPNAAKREINAWAFERNPNVILNSCIWKAGNAYGLEAAPVQKLPKSFEFDNFDKRDSYKVVTFLPSGRAETSVLITIAEKNEPRKSTSITVTPEGLIDYIGTWQ